jgi:hypothetical protein
VHAQLRVVGSRVERPAYVWPAVILELFTAVGALPVGAMFLADSSGGMVGMQPGWIEGTVFGSYAVPGLYLLLVNGLGMVVLALLTVLRHPVAPWLTGALGVGLIVWILVEVLVLPLTSFLTWLFLAIGIAMGFVALFWLRRTGQLRLW